MPSSTHIKANSIGGICGDFGAIGGTSFGIKAVGVQSRLGPSGSGLVFKDDALIPHRAFRSFGRKVGSPR